MALGACQWTIQSACDSSSKIMAQRLRVEAPLVRDEFCGSDLGSHKSCKQSVLTRVTAKRDIITNSAAAAAVAAQM